MPNPVTNTGFNKHLYNVAGAYTGLAYHQDYYDLGPVLVGAAGLSGIGPAANGIKWSWTNRKDLGGAWNTSRQNFNTNIEFNKSLKGNTFGETLNNRYTHSKLVNLSKKFAEPKAMQYGEFSQLSSSKQLKYNNNIIKSGYYNDLRRLIAEAKGLKGKELTAKMKEIEQAAAKAKLNIHNAKVTGIIKPATKAGKAVRAVKNVTGITKASGKIAEATASSSPSILKTVSKAGKLAKGSAALAAVAVACEVPDLIETKNKLGNKAFKKQLGKTAVNVGAEVAGYAAGSALAGMAMGAAFGTVVPVVGNIVGAVVGLAVGWLAGKLTRKYITGKSELEKAKEKETIELAEQANNNSEVREKLLLAVGEGMENTNPNDAKTKEILASYEAAVEEHNAQIAAQSSTQRTTTAAAQNYTSSNVNRSRQNNISENLWKQLNGLMNYSTNTASMNYNNFNTNFNPYMFQTQYPSTFGGQGYNPYSMYPQFGFTA